MIFESSPKPVYQLNIRLTSSEHQSEILAFGNGYENARRDIWKMPWDGFAI
jgi:hypothetical protein